MMLPAGKEVNSYLTAQSGPTFSSGLGLKEASGFHVTCLCSQGLRKLALGRKGLPGIQQAENPRWTCLVRSQLLLLLDSLGQAACPGGWKTIWPGHRPQ